MKNIYQTRNACCISNLIAGVCGHTVQCWCVCECVYVGEPGDCVYFRGNWNARVAYIKTDRPIWKQSSNMSWKKLLYHSERDVKSLPASIFSFKAGNVILTELVDLYCVLRYFYKFVRRIIASVSTSDPKRSNVTNRETKEEEEFYQRHLLQIGSSGN